MPNAAPRLTALLAPLLLALSCPGDAAPDAPSGGGQPQILFDVRIIELPSAALASLFGKKGAAPGRDVTADLLQRLSEAKGADILSAPRVVTLAGQSAQIKVSQEMSFATSFRVVETNGAWEPVMKSVEIGISATVVATPYPHDPERLHGSAEITLSELASVSEQTVTPPGNQGPLKLSSPVISSSTLTASFNVSSGQTVVLGGLQSAKAAGGSRSVLVLMGANVMQRNAELIEKLKGRVIQDISFEQAPLGEVLSRLSQEAKGADINFTVLCSSITSSRDKFSVKNAEGREPQISLSARNMPLYDLLRLVAQLAGATVSFDQNAVTFKLP